MELGTSETRQKIKLNDEAFVNILSELRNLGLFNITSKLSKVYHDNSAIQFEHGLETGEKIFRN